MRDPREGVTATGQIRTGAARHRVPAAYEPLLSEATDAVEALDAQASLYLYGSVATGTAVPPTSDVDLLTIGLAAQPAAELQRRLSTAFARVCRGVEIAVSHPADLTGTGDQAHGNRVFLRHYCVHLRGPDPAAGLPPYLADARAARGFNGDLEQHLRRWRERLAAASDHAPVGRAAARKTLLAVAGLVSVHDRTWTTDRATAARRWGQLHPGQAAGLELLLDWATRPVPADADVEPVLERVVAPVAAQFGELVGFWEEQG